MRSTRVQILCLILVAASAAASTQTSGRNARSCSRSNGLVRHQVGLERMNPTIAPKTRAAAPPQTTGTKTAKAAPQESPSSSPSFTPLLSKSVLVSCLAFLAGIGDVISYRRYGCYANMMTGNTIRLTTALAEVRFRDAVLFGSLLISYGGGVAVFRAVDLFRKNRRHGSGGSSRPSCFAVTPIILSFFVLVDLLVKMRGDDVSFRGFIPILALGFGMLNAASSDALGGTSTFAMTGHVTKLGQAVADRLFMAGKKRWRKGSKTSAFAMAFFAAGIASGVVLSNRCGTDLGNILPPFTTLGVLYTLLLGLYSVEAPDLSRFRKDKCTANKQKETVNQLASASFLNITMDGWTTMPAGPAPFQVGQQ